MGVRGLGPTAPAGLDEALAARGYAVEAPVWVQTSALARRAVPQAPADARIDTRTEST
jgi:hypothetical protein